MGIWDEIINASIQKKVGQNEESKNSCLEFGAICPQCRSAYLEYNGKLNLVCLKCGYEAVVGFT